MDTYQVIARDRRDLLGEGVTWSERDRAVYWVDILGQRLNRLNLGAGAGVIDEWPIGEMIGWVIERADRPGFIAGLRTGFVSLSLDPVTITPIAAPEPHLPENRMNDAAADPWGRIWAGTMHMTGARADGALYRLDTDLTWSRADTGYHIANGPAISADGAWLYHTDSALGVVYRFALSPEGLGPRETFITFPEDWGSPDGMCADADGGLWIAHWGGGCVSRFGPDGVRERSIALPASQITRCCFAGDGLDRMFVTSASDGVDEPLAGALFEIDPGCRGIAPRSFAG